MLVRRRALIVIGLMLAACLVAGIVYFTFPPPGKGGVTGRKWSSDDTGLPDFISTEGRFLVIPGVTVREVWPDDKADPQKELFKYFSAEYDFEELQDQYGATIAEVQFNGRFRVLAPKGPVVICLLDPGMFGCSELELPENGSLRASRGIGGFWLEVK